MRTMILVAIYSVLGVTSNACGSSSSSADGSPDGGAAGSTAGGSETAGANGGDTHRGDPDDSGTGRDSGGAACDGEQTTCGGACVDTRSDPEHCGSCDAPCPTGRSCADSVCAPPAGSCDEVPAFPGAEGFGACSLGGRGGTVIKVTNLDDDGPGSLRAAATARGPRTVVFETSGIINLDSILEIRSPFLTLAGQTSPGGVTVIGYPVRILTSDVIVRHMRFRRGSEKGDPEGQGESLFVGNGSDVIIDHCSISWATDECMQVGSYWGDIYGVTISWSIISEGLLDPHPEDDHAMGLLVSDKFYDVSPPEVTLHHNYVAHHYDRSPQLKGDLLVDHRNNVVYDWYNQIGSRLLVGAIDSTIPRANIVGNYSERGPNTSDNGCAGYFSSDAGGSGTNRVFVEDNRGCGRPTGMEAQWAVTEEWGPTFLDTSWQRTAAWDMSAQAQQPGVPVTTTAMTREYALEILSTVGATLPVRDPVDARVVQEFADGNGGFIADVVYPDDFPTFENLPSPADVDDDGMSDAWEVSEGLSVGVDDSAGDLDGDGYTNIEEYLQRIIVTGSL